MLLMAVAREAFANDSKSDHNTGLSIVDYCSLIAKNSGLFNSHVFAPAIIAASGGRGQRRRSHGSAITLASSGFAIVSSVAILFTNLSSNYFWRLASGLRPF